MTSKQPIHSVLFDNQNEYYAQPTSGDNLQFYSSSYGDQYSTNYYASPPAGDMRPTNYEFSNSGSFWSAFGTGGYADEPPLLEELGLNFEHIKTKSLTVLNPFRTVPSTIMDDTDLAGPLLFIFLFGTFLLLSRKAHFGYIYGVGVLGVLSIYLILNLMSENGIDGSRTASVLGYCLLPMVMLSGLSAVLGETKVNLEDVRQTEFYKQPWVKEAVFHYLTSKTQQKMQELLATQSSSKQS
ncbi:Putative Yip1 domain family, member 5 [Rhizopus microsporus]|nr:Putative Yip1 domain family, member 5 [Rhizopus microsporus]